jgi:hypothetical protein
MTPTHTEKSSATSIYREFVRIAGSRGGFLLSHLFNISDEKFEQWINLSETQIVIDSGMSLGDLHAATARLKRLGLVERTKSGFRIVPAKLECAIHSKGALQ